MKYFGVQSALMFDQVFAQVSPKERGLVHLPEWLNFLYHFIRATRLVVQNTAGAWCAPCWSIAVV
jgi:hypothetical protein